MFIRDQAQQISSSKPQKFKAIRSAIVSYQKQLIKQNPNAEFKTSLKPKGQPLISIIETQPNFVTLAFNVKSNRCIDRLCSISYDEAFKIMQNYCRNLNKLSRKHKNREDVENEIERSFVTGMGGILHLVPTGNLYEIVEMISRLAIKATKDCPRCDVLALERQVEFKGSGFLAEAMDSGNWWSFFASTVNGVGVLEKIESELMSGRGRSKGRNNNEIVKALVSKGMSVHLISKQQLSPERLRRILNKVGVTSEVGARKMERENMFVLDSQGESCRLRTYENWLYRGSQS